MNVIDLLLAHIPGKHKLTPSGWYSFNAVCCQHNGERADRRGRGGIKPDPDGSFGYSCFNCGFKSRYEIGRALSIKTRKLMTWIGLTDREISEISLNSLRNRKPSDLLASRKIRDKYVPNFQKQVLPSDARPINASDVVFVDYLKSRGFATTDYNFRITPTAIGRNKNRIIVPYMYDNNVVGWTSRFLDVYKPKYHNEHQQPGYVFGMDVQHPRWAYGIVCEGIFDALSINALGVLHNEINEKQRMLLNRLNREIIVVPDQDKSGLTLIDHAISAGYSVSIPEWGVNNNGVPIHDINEAVQMYGKLNTLLSILTSKESSKIKITVMRNKLKRKL